MRKIKNPWLHKEGYNCFGCAPENPIGLHMEFFEEGDDILCFWRPCDYYQGWMGVLHGGIISTLIDETAGWVVTRKLQAAGMTSRLNVAFHKAVMSNDVQITIKARLVEQKRQFATISVIVENAHGEVCAEGEAIYFVLSEEKSKEMGFIECEVEGDNLLPF
jgi:uncharacterized protein (TIGR00369 family)